MITYQDLYDALRIEKFNQQLQKLPDNFLQDIAEYIKDKKNILNKDAKGFEEVIKKTRRQLDNALSLINELFTIRCKKILNLALVASKTGVSKQDVENMLPDERQLFENVVKQLESLNAKIQQIIEGKEEKKDLKNNILIRFTQDVPEFLDESGNVLGPFKSGDIANLPKQIAELLINSNKAEQLQ